MIDYLWKRREIRQKKTLYKVIHTVAAAILSVLINDVLVSYFKGNQRLPWGLVCVLKQLAACDRFSGSSPEQWRQGLLWKDVSCQPNDHKMFWYQKKNAPTHHSSGPWKNG